MMNSLRASSGKPWKRRAGSFWRLRRQGPWGLRFWSPASPSQQVVPGGFDGKRRISHNLFRDYRHFANSLLESALGGLVRLAHLEFVRHKFFADIDGKNLGPRPAPDALGKHAIIWAQFVFDLPRQCSSQPAVSSI